MRRIYTINYDADVLSLLKLFHKRAKCHVGTSNKTDIDWAVGRFALLLRDWTSVSGEWFLKPLSRCVECKILHLLDDTLL